MKNLQKLLIAAVFATIMSSTKPNMSFSEVLHSTNILKCPEESTETPTAESNQRIYIDKNTMDKNFKRYLMHAIPIQCGFFGAIAGAAGSHALKKAKRTLTKISKLTPETLVQLNKGIRNNRIGILASLVFVASPIAVAKLNDMSNARKQAEDLLKKLNKETI